MGALEVGVEPPARPGGMTRPTPASAPGPGAYFDMKPYVAGATSTGP
jgi:hypothetical protein